MRLKSEKKMVYLQADKCTLEKTLIAKAEKLFPNRHPYPYRGNQTTIK